MEDKCPWCEHGIEDIVEYCDTDGKEFEDGMELETKCPYCDKPLIVRCYITYLIEKAEGHSK